MCLSNCKRSETVTLGSLFISWEMRYSLKRKALSELNAHKSSMANSSKGMLGSSFSM